MVILLESQFSQNGYLPKVCQQHPPLMKTLKNTSNKNNKEHKSRTFTCSTRKDETKTLITKHKQSYISSNLI